MCKPHLGTHVLEIGAGHGDFTRRLARDRFVTAVDSSKRCVERLSAEYEDAINVDVRHVDAEGLVDDKRYDSALLINLIEHVDDDLGVLTNIRDVLKPGGRVIIFAPAFDGLYSDFDRLVGHRRRYRLSQLVTVLDRAGYGIVDARYVNSLGAIAWWLFARRMHQTPTKPGPVRLYDRLAVPLLRRREMSHPPRFGQSVFVVAEARQAIRERPRPVRVAPGREVGSS
jgi:SAM-dependent methyltransferase